MTRIVNSDTPMCRDPQSVNAQAPLQLAGDRKGTLYEPEGHGPARQRVSAGRFSRRSWSHTLIRLLTTTALVTVAGAASAASSPQPPPVVLPPPVSDQGLTPYGTYSRTAGGGGTAFFNVKEGTFTLDPVDLAIPKGRGVSFVLERYYNSGAAEAGFFGLGWTSLLDARIDRCSGSDLKYRSPSGAIYPIQSAFPGGHTSRIQGLHATHDDSGRIIFDNGIVFTFGTDHQVRCSASNGEPSWYLSSIGDRNGNTIIIQRDSTTGFPFRIQDALRRTIEITPTAFGRISKISPPGGLASIVYDYPSGQLNTVTRADQITRYTYDRTTQLLSTIQDPRGYLTRFTYELSAACKNRIHWIEYATQDPDKVDRYVYKTCTDDGRPIQGQASVKDPNQHVTTYSWNDGDPGPTTITDALLRVTKVQYGQYDFDVLSTSKISTSNQQDAVRTKTWAWGFDSLGSDPEGTLQETHDSFDGQDIVTKYYYTDERPPCPDPSQPRTSPPTLLDLTCGLNRFLPNYVVNPDGWGTSIGHDERGNLIGAQSDAEHWILTPRNPDGTLSAIERPRGKTRFAYTYKGVNLDKITVTDPLGRVSETTYDSVGRPETKTSASGQRTQFGFDSLSRLVRVKYEDGWINFKYDGNNNLLSMEESWNGTTTFAYDPRNRVIEKSSPLGTVSYAYDGVGNLTTKTDAGGTVTYAYDAVNQLMSLTDRGTVVTYSTDAEPRDENNRSHKVTYGINHRDNVMTISRDWDGAGRVKRILAQAPTSGTLVDLRYEYELGSNLLHTFTDTDGTIAEYSYDGLNQLTGETKRTADGRNAGQRAWTYDANNNRASQTLGGLHGMTTYYDYDDADQLLGNTYDRDGNLTIRSDGMKLDYDAGYTMAITPPASAGGAAAKLTMTYTGLDQTQRTSLKIGKEPATTFTYDGTGIGPSGVQPGVAGATADYITRTPGGGLVSLHRGNRTYFYITDRLGSVVALTGIGTVVKNRYRYSPWGEILAQDLTKDYETVPQPFKFAGAEFDATTGLYKMGARYYDPAVGQFTQLDALGGGYRYALNNPINFIDPTGYEVESDLEGVGKAFFAAYTVWKLIMAVWNSGAGEELGDALCDEQNCTDQDYSCGVNCQDGQSGHDDGAGGAGGSNDSDIPAGWKEGEDYILIRGTIPK
jgi:RHS repeat-associated protein